ncbi:MAG TPA: hypothetical protein VK071_05165 [Tissierellales bacterium]|nr:hypothetical protein [Tissierellales bacterium]
MNKIDLKGKFYVESVGEKRSDKKNRGWEIRIDYILILRKL